VPSIYLVSAEVTHPMKLHYSYLYVDLRKLLDISKFQYTHILHLVLSNNPFVEVINHHSPIGRSDHVCLEIICDFDVDKIEQVSMFDYSK